MKIYKVLALSIAVFLFTFNYTHAQCLTCNSQDPAGTVSGAGVEASIGTWNIVTATFSGQDYAVFSLSQGYTYEWQICGAGGFSAPMLTLFTGSGCNSQTFVTSNSGACANITYIAPENQNITILLSETDCSANATNLSLQWRSTCSPNCGADVNHGGADWIISTDAYVGGNHTNIGNFVVNAGVTAYLSCHTFHVEAVNITVNGIIDGNYKGSVGGTGGAGGSASAGSDGSCGSGGPGQPGTDGQGLGPGFAGMAGLLGGCTELDCGACTNGYIAGSGGAGSGSGAAHYANGGTSGSGAQAADVNGSDAIGGFGGSGPFFGAFAYGDNTSLQVLTGSGGAGAGGGGGGYTPGINGGNGGAGGGRVELIASNTFTCSVTGAVLCNGYDGEHGGNGGFGSLDDNWGCFSGGDLENTDNCGVCPATGNYYGTGGAGGGAGGGSGGGILISSADLATILGNLEVAGGEGGHAGYPNTTHGACFRNARGGSGGVGGRIKIFRNPCLENQINPTSDVLGGLPGASVGGSVERAPSGVLLLLDHPSYVAFDAGEIGSDQDICINGLPDALNMTTPPSGGIGTYTYQWWKCTGAGCANPPVGYTPIGGAISNTYSPPALAVTTYYSLMVQSGSEECRQWTSPVIINVHPDPDISINASANDVCENQPITITATINGGFGACTIQWQYSDDGVTWNNVGTNSTTYSVPTANSFTNRQYRATYDCTADGCNMGTSNIEVINVAEPPEWDNISVTPPELCSGGDVTFSASVNGGLGGTIVWYVSPAGAGTWVVVTSPDNPGTGSWDYQPVYTPGGSGCAIADAPVNTVNVVDDPQITISTADTETCENDPLTLTSNTNGGSGTCSYQWQYRDGFTWVNVGTDSDTYTIPANVPFLNEIYRCIYTCTGTGCDQAISNELTITVFENPDVTATANPNPQCANEPVDLTANGSNESAPYTYFWDNGLGAGQNHTVNPASNTTYSVTLTDSQGCTAEATVDVTVNQLPAVTATATPNPQCAGEPVDLTANGTGGTAPYTYDWDNGLGAGQNHTVTPSANTTYSVTVTDNNGCTAENTVDVVINEPPALTASADPNPQCASEPVDLSATASGGTAPYSYLWDNGLGAGANHTVNPVVNTTYSVTVTDNLGCTAEASVSVMLNTLPNVTATASPNPQCANEPVDLSANAVGGTGPYTYDWDNGLGTGQNHTVNPASNTTYTVTVTDANGCSAEIPVNVIVNQLPAVTPTATPNPQCANEPVDLTANGTGGTAPYSYTWDNGLGAGQNHTVTISVNTTYSVTITDDLGCSAENTINVVINEVPTLTATADPNPQCSAEPVDLSANGAGGTAPYSYVWDNGLGAGQNHTVNPVANTTYSVTVTDNAGCTAETTVNVLINLLPSVTATANPNPQCANEPVDLGANGAGGTAPYSYTWDNGLGAGQNHTVNPAANTTYTVTVTDINGCTAENSVAVSVFELPDVIASASPNPQCAGEDVILTANANDGLPPYSYTWDNGLGAGQSHTVTPVSNTSYTVTVTDGNGCTNENTVNVVINEAPSVIVTETQQATCGTNNGEAVATASNGTAPYSYLWSNADNSADGIAENLPPGLISVVVTDDNGCTTAGSVVITSPSSMVLLTSEVTPVSCFSGSDGTGNINISGGTEPYDVTWSNGITSGSQNGVSAGDLSISNLTTGTYIVQVTDADNCVITETLAITQPPAITLISNITSQLLCFGDSDAEAEVTINGGTPLYNYTWDNGSVSGSANNAGSGPHTLSGLDAGIYTIVVTDANSCTESFTMTVTQPDIIAINAAMTGEPSCNGFTDGTASVTISGGTLNYSMSWDNGSVNGNMTNINGGPHNLTNLNAGNYTIIVTDANSCTQSANMSITEPAALTITLNLVQDVSCFNGSDGIFSVLAGGGTAPFDIIWDNGTSSGSLIDVTAGPHNISNTDDGTFNVQITDANGCSISDNIIISQPAVLNLSSVMTSAASCFGYADGEADITVSGGTANYNLAWNNGTTSGNVNGVTAGTYPINSLTAGNYIITVTDDNSCTLTANLTITQPAQITNIINVTSNVSCNGGNDGAFALLISGGTANYDINWTNGTYSDNIINTDAGPHNITNIPAGNYSLTITDANACEQTETFNITQPAAITLTVNSSVNVSCTGGSNGSFNVSVGGGTPLYDLSWDSGTTSGSLTGINAGTQNITNLDYGTYTIIVTDNSGCTQTTSILIDQPATVLNMSVLSVTDASCIGVADGSATVEATGGVSPYTFVWDNPGGTDENITNVTSGTYNVTVTDAWNCTFTIPVVIGQPANGLTATYTTTDVTCNGWSDGSITISPSGGTPAYTYIWNPAVSGNNTANGLAAGTYNVTVNDAGTCELILAIDVIVDPDALSVSFVSSDSVSCFGGNNGSLTIIASGGQFPYDYLWSNGPTTETTTGATGNYTITVTDDNGCEVNADSTIYEPAALSGIISSTSHVNCFGGNDGSITVSASAGTAPYTYYWENSAGTNTGITTPAANGLVADTYYISITDSNGCGPVALTATVNEPVAALSVSVSEVNQPTCNGDSDGSVTAIASGGTMPVFSYQWDAPIAFFNGQTPSALSAGNYSVTITDTNGCTAENSFTLGQPSPVTVGITFIQPGCNGDSDGSATATGNGGNGGFTYHWENSSATTISSVATASGLATGTYYVTATDASGCAATSSVLVTQPAVLTVSLSGIDASTYGNNDGSATANPSGGTVTYSYEWENQANPGVIIATTQTASNLYTGTYCVTVTDLNGCTVSDCIFLNQPPDQLAGVLANHDDISCFGYDDGSITINGYGGTPPYIFVWEHPSGTNIGSGPTISNLEPGNYYFTIMDQLAFEWDTIITITEPALFTLESITNTNVSCFGGSDAHIEVTVNDGTAPYSYSWENISGPVTTNNDTLYNVPAGTYSVTITDANGCGPLTVSSAVNQPPVLDVTITLVSNPVCFGDSNGEINTTVSGGTPPYISYQWAAPIDAYSGTNPTGLASGSYTVTVTDNLNCTATDTYVLTQPTAVSGILNATSTTGFGASDGNVSVTPAGGTPGYTYEWENSANPGIIISISDFVNNLPAGNYCVTVTDTHLCEFTDCIDLPEPEQLVVIIDAENIDCNGNDNGSVNAVVTGGIPVYTYVWRNSMGSLVSTNQSITDLPPDTYSVTVTDANGYTANASVIISEPDIIVSPVASISHVTCFGLSNGSIILNPSGGEMPYNMSWYEINTPSDILSTSSILNNVPAGLYHFSLTDNNNCSHDTVIEITQPDELIISSVEVHNLPCPYDINTGWAVVHFSGATQPYTFTWTDASSVNIGVNNDTITGLFPGNYNILIQDNNACPSANTGFSVTIPEAFNLSGITDSVSCFNGNDGSVLVSIEGGTPGYSYDWTPAAENTAYLQNLNAGNYNVIVSDANSCTAEASFIVGEPDAELTVSGSQTEFILCYDDSTAEFELTVSGGTPPYSINWSDTEANTGFLNLAGEGTISQPGLPSSDYSITVTDSRFCETTTSISISQPVNIIYSFEDIEPASCNGFADASVAISANGGTGNLNYLWDEMTLPVTTTVYSDIIAGWHYITITDENMCQKYDSVFISQPDILTSDLVDDLYVLCYGDSTANTSIVIYGGTPDYTIQWYNESYENAGNSQWINGLGAGDYYLSITDSHYCLYVDTVTVNQPDALATSMDSINPSCYMYQDGQIWVTVTGGTPEYSYDWDSPGATDSDTAFSVPQGMWHVTVTDANMCRIYDSVSVVHPDPIAISDVTTHVDCSAFMGTSTLTVTGGTVPYEYIWSTEDSTSSVINLPGGPHTVTVTDSNSCSLSYEINVPVVGRNYVNLLQTGYILCYGDYTGALQVQVSGHPPYSYNWNITPASDTSFYDNLPAGEYSVTVNDSWNCIGDTTYTITQPDELIISFASQNVLCRNESTGWISTTVTGGTVDYSLNWHHDNSSNYDLTDLPVGTYYLDVTDGNGCTTSNFITITEPDSSLFAAVAVTNTNCFGSDDGQAFAQGQGGTPPYSYHWAGPNNHIIDTAVTEMNLFPGYYRLTVTDANNCKYYTQASIGEPGPITISVDQYMGPSCQGNWDGYIALDSVTGGTPPYYIRISGDMFYLEQESLFVDSLYGGSYRIDIVDSHNCIQQGSSYVVILTDADIDCLQIPAAFSPNGDGYNDEWQIDNLYMFPKILIQVYNRWGQLLYEGGAWDDFWDGTYNGNVVPTGAYIYHIDMNNNLKPRTGTVTIVR